MADECNDDTFSVIAANQAQFATSTTSSSSGSGSVASRPHVYLNVYNLMEVNRNSASGLSAEALNVLGMGIHHSGVEIFGEEWSFGADATGRNDPQTEGIFSVYPRTACGHFKEQIDLGLAPIGFTRQKLEIVLNELRPKWKAISYHILSHNCNVFAATLVKAIDVFFPSATPEEERLSHKVPAWTNRVAGVGAAVVPNSLVKSIMEAVNPPSAIAPELVNKIYMPAFEGVYPSRVGPLPLPAEAEAAAAEAERQQAEKEAEAEGGLFGGLKAFGGFAKNVAGTVATAVKSTVVNAIHESDKKDYIAAFPDANAEDLISAYLCTVIHINRPQKAKVYITRKGIAVGGDHDLRYSLPYTQVGGYYYGAAVRPDREDGNALPVFVPTADTEKIDCLLIMLKDASSTQASNKTQARRNEADDEDDEEPTPTNRGSAGGNKSTSTPSYTRMIPLLDLSYMGFQDASRALNKHRDVALAALAYIDNAYRKDVGM